MTKCKDDKHEFEWIETSCGCEVEVCYKCDHWVCQTPCEYCKTPEE